MTRTEKYFEDKKNEMPKYIKNIDRIYSMESIKTLSGAMTIIALWDMFMMVNYLAGNKVSGCLAETYILTFSDKPLYSDLVTTIHTSRNKISHIADDIEILVGDVAAILRSYKYYDVLQKDLDMIFKGTNLTVSAKRLFEIYDIKLQRKYNDTEAGAQKSSIMDKLQDELPDVVNEFKG